VPVFVSALDPRAHFRSSPPGGHTIEKGRSHNELGHHFARDRVQRPGTEFRHLMPVDRPALNVLRLPVVGMLHLDVEPEPLLDLLPKQRRGLLDPRPDSEPFNLPTSSAFSDIGIRLIG